MTLKHKHLLYITVLLTLGIACKKPYNPSVNASSKNYLVVEGVINSGNDSTFIKLSRAIELTDKISSKAEKGAIISVDADGGASYALTEKSPGEYVCGPLNLDKTKQYQLKIGTTNGQHYQSDVMKVKEAPPIDEINYEVKPDGLQINVNSHDGTNNTRYYRWDYEEDWRFHTKFYSAFKSDGEKIVPRDLDDNIYYCFGSVKSNTINLRSTVKLSQDVVSEMPITTIGPGSQKINMRYSMLLKQYALTKDAFDFWENLKKNTEQLGSIFDALPSQLTGNIHNVKDPLEPVIGYMSVGTIQTKRIYINRNQLPESWVTDYPEGCVQDTAYYNRDGLNEVEFFLINKRQLPTQAIGGGFLRTDFECADCTLTGKLKQPDFWEN